MAIKTSSSKTQKYEDTYRDDRGPFSKRGKIDFIHKNNRLTPSEIIVTNEIFVEEAYPTLIDLRVKYFDMEINSDDAPELTEAFLHWSIELNTSVSILNESVEKFAESQFDSIALRYGLNEDMVNNLIKLRREMVRANKNSLHGDEILSSAFSDWALRLKVDERFLEIVLDRKIKRKDIELKQFIKDRGLAKQK